MHTSSSGTIQSPLYPQDYPNNAHCTYLITVEYDYRVVLTFDSFSTEQGYDVVFVYDGTDEYARQIARYALPLNKIQLLSHI